MKIVKIALKACKIIFIVLLSIALLFSISSIVKRVFLKEEIPLVLGLGNAIVVSGSMEPTINVGDIIIIQKRNNYDVGDIVTFKNKSYVTHRIMEKTQGGYITKGDANNTVDSEVNENQVIGKVIKIVPKTGNIVFLLRNPLNIMIIALIVIALIEVPNLFKKDTEKSLDERR